MFRSGYVVFSFGADLRHESLRCPGPHFQKIPATSTWQVASQWSRCILWNLVGDNDMFGNKWGEKCVELLLKMAVKQLTVGGMTTGTFNKKEKGSKRLLTHSLQRHLIVGSSSKNLELQRDQLLGILCFFCSLGSPNVHLHGTMVRTSGRERCPELLEF